MGLDSVELLVAIENEFEIEISNIEAEDIITVEDYYEIILKKNGLTKKNEMILKRLIEIIADRTGIAIERITPGLKIIEDLRID